MGPACHERRPKTDVRDVVEVVERRVVATERRDQHKLHPSRRGTGKINRKLMGALPRYRKTEAEFTLAGAGATVAIGRVDSPSLASPSA